MKVLIILAVLYFMQATAHVVTTDQPELKHHSPEHHENKASDHKKKVINQNQNSKEKQHVGGQEQKVGHQHIDVHQRTDSSGSGKVDVQIPVKVQHTVAGHKDDVLNSQQNSNDNQKDKHVTAHQKPSKDVSQDIPHVEKEQNANKQRMVRSLKNRAAWQDMQVNAVGQPGKCEFICNPLDTTVCGYNGRCHWEFESQCDLNTYNCLNTQSIFNIVNFSECQDDGAVKCYRGDM